MLCLRLLQSALVHLNTIFLPRVLGDGDRALASEDRGALSPLFGAHSNLLGRYHFTHPDNLQDELRCSAPTHRRQRRAATTSPSRRILRGHYSHLYPPRSHHPVPGRTLAAVHRVRVATQLWGATGAAVIGGGSVPRASSRTGR